MYFPVMWAILPVAYSLRLSLALPSVALSAIKSNQNFVAKLAPEYVLSTYICIWCFRGLLWRARYIDPSVLLIWRFPFGGPCIIRKSAAVQLVVNYEGSRMKCDGDVHLQILCDWLCSLEARLEIRNDGGCYKIDALKPLHFIYFVYCSCR